VVERANIRLKPKAFPIRLILVSSLGSEMSVLVTHGAKAAQNITIDGLCYSYKGLEVFREFSLQAQSKTVVLRGPSGCGKTTLLKLLSGNLLPDRMRSMPDSERSCLVLQEDSLLPWLSGTENVMLFTKMNLSRFQSHPMYELVADFIHRKACHMSYGQRRLVELFRAVIFKPRFLYLDEPFNFLDEKRIGMVLPFLQGQFLEEVNLTMSNHHSENISLLDSADVFTFDGLFPVSSIERLA
jgi:ABC-type nitrate/sulfonate/bicarbonate transport system ATPase subunit